MDKPSRCILPLSCILLFILAGNLPAAEKVGSSGYIVPGGGLIKVAALKQGIITALKVHRGDTVKRGAPLFTLAESTADLAQLKLAELDLQDATENGAKAIELQRLKIESARNQLEIAEKRLTRFNAMGQDFSALAQKEEREHEVKSAWKNLEVLQAELEHMTIDNRLNAQRATERLKMARATAGLSTVVAPVNGAVIDFFQNPGDLAGTGPSLTMADLSTMYVVAEVSESDVLKLREGMRATVSHSALASPISGKVESIGRYVTENVKTVNVRIRLDEKDMAARLLNMEVNVTIDLGGGVGK